jgi:hypothetical protein
MIACRTQASRTAAAWRDRNPIKFLSQWNFSVGRSMRRACSRSPQRMRPAPGTAGRRRDLARWRASLSSTTLRPLVALSVISLLRSNSVAFGCEADMRTVDRSNKSDVNDPLRSLAGPKYCAAANPDLMLAKLPFRLLGQAADAIRSTATARVHHAARRRSGVAAHGARAAGEYPDYRVSQCRHCRGLCPLCDGIPPRSGSCRL